MRITFLIPLAALMLPTLVLAQGPVSTYYLTAGDQLLNWRIQGLGAVPSAQAHPGDLGEYAIAVSADVRTLGNGFSGFDGQQRLGAQYDLNFNYLNVDYSYPTLGAQAFYDGTTDGIFNYAVDYRSGEVLRFNSNWTAPTVIFDSQFGVFNALGITYDASNGSLWVSQWDGNQVANFAMDGTLLSSFNANVFSNNLTSLALDPATDTLWMGSQGAQGTFAEYSKAGVLLQTQTYATMTSQNTLGGEFRIAAIPEPSTLLLVGLGVTGTYLLRSKVRRRKALTVSTVGRSRFNPKPPRS